MAVRSISNALPRHKLTCFPHLSEVWLWPHLLSLDAPLIAVLWQVLSIRELALPVSWGEPSVLALCVWCVYVGDRVLDAMRPQTPGWEPIRKKFYRRYISLALAGEACLLLLVLPVAYYLLKRDLFYAGWWLALPLFVYLVIVHLAPVRWWMHWPREMVVACLFALGVFLAVWIENGKNYRPLWGSATLFTLLCWANCCAIEVWEWQENVFHAEGKPSISTRWVVEHLTFVALGIACSAVWMGSMTVTPSRFSAAVFCSGVALAALGKCRPRLSMNGLRVAADLALCTPLPVLLFRISR